MTSTLQTSQPRLIVGVDTHQRTHHAVVIDTTGRRIAGAEFAASAAGYRQLTDWALGHGQVEAFGVESTGSYGAGLTRHLLAEGMDVVEVNRPDKTTRARQGKSDPIDAEHAARAVLAGTATARTKVSTGIVEAVRALLVARGGAVKARTAAVSQLRDLITTAPEEIREVLLPLTTQARIAKAAALRPDLTRLHEPAHAARHALRALARRIQALDKEITDAEKALKPLVASAVPTLIARTQISTLTGAQLMVTAGENLDRFRSEAAFAKLTGTAPLPASSGKTRRMRLNTGGDRQANKALHLIAVGRLRSDPRTRDYFARRRAQNLGTKEILRCLKRAIAREVFHALRTDLLRA